VYLYNTSVRSVIELDNAFEYLHTHSASNIHADGMSGEKEWHETWNTGSVFALLCGISLETVKEETRNITEVPNTPYFIYCFKWSVKILSIMPLLVMILIKEENAVHTSQTVKRSIEEDLHLISLLNPKLLPEFRLDATSFKNSIHKRSS
jgi:hypothetical protein